MRNGVATRISKPEMISKIPLVVRVEDENCETNCEDCDGKENRATPKETTYNAPMTDENTSNGLERVPREKDTETANKQTPRRISMTCVHALEPIQNRRGDVARTFWPRESV